MGDSETTDGSAIGFESEAAKQLGSNGTVRSSRSEKFFDQRAAFWRPSFAMVAAGFARRPVLAGAFAHGSEETFAELVKALAADGQPFCGHRRGDMAGTETAHQIAHQGGTAAIE